MKQGDILIWDSHFGKESGRPLQRFLESPEMQLLKYYKIKEGESVFEAYVMEKRN